MTLFMTVVAAHAQEPITRNPDAVELRLLWMKRGSVVGGELIGDGIGTVGDVDGDGISEIAMRSGYTGEWMVYHGQSPAPADTPMWRCRSTGELSYPVLGDFWGTGHKAIVIVRDSCFVYPGGGTTCYLRLNIYRTDDGRIADTPSAVINTGMQYCLRNAMVADLDGDGYDDLILARACSYPDIRIWRGGPEFERTCFAPNYVFGDSESTPTMTFYADVGDIDGDGYLDLVTGGDYQTHQAWKFYYGSSTTPGSWRRPDRVVELPEAYWNVDAYIGLVDADGDSVSDVRRSMQDLPLGGGYLFLSRNHESARTRSFALDSADRFWPDHPDCDHKYGYLTDTIEQFPTILMGSSTLLAFTSGANGPDLSYDAYTTNGLGGAFTRVSAVGDCNGDGWDDVMTGDPNWYQFDQGIAQVWAGGPYIPRDSTTLGVRDLPTAGHSAGVSVWPNPVRTELHVAWRGDLRRMPARYTLYDVRGALRSSGSIEPRRGTVVLDCSTLEAGVYLLRLLGSDGAVVAETRVVRVR